MQDGEETVSSDVGFLTEMLNEIMAGDEILLGFSGGTIAIVIGLIAISVIGGIISRRFLFPKIMDLISKSDRIDGRTLLAPKISWLDDGIPDFLRIDVLARR